MNSLILTVFFAVLAQDGGGTGEQESQVVDVTPEPAYVMIDVAAKIKKSYAYVDRSTVVETNKMIELPPGAHEIIVLATGYYDLPLEVNLKSGETKTLKVRAMMPGVSTLTQIANNAGSMVGYSFPSDWTQTDVHPWKVDGNSVIVDGNPLPGATGMGIYTYAQYRSTEFVYSFAYRAERGRINVICNGKKLPATGGWHHIIIYAARQGSYMLVDWAKYALGSPSTEISLTWKTHSNARIVLKDFSFVDVAAQKAEAAGN